MVVVAGEAGMVGGVFGGIDAGEGAEVVDKVRLIEIAAIDGDIGPPDGPTRRDAAEHALETANAAKKLRGQADVMLEEFDETARAEAGFGGDFADVSGLRGVEKRFDGVFDRRMVVEHTSGALAESEFDGAEFGEGSGRLEDAVAELSREGSPNVTEFQMLIAQFSAGIAAMLVGVLAGESPASGTCPVAAVVISGGGEGDQTVGSPEVKVPVGWVKT